MMNIDSKEVCFVAIVDKDGIIRPPAGVIIPPGQVEVVVRSTLVASLPASQPSSEEEDIASLRTFLLGMAAEAEAIDDELPDDMAENHNHYAHGAPKK